MVKLTILLSSDMESLPKSHLKYVIAVCLFYMFLFWKKVNFRQMIYTLEIFATQNSFEYVIFFFTTTLQLSTLTILILFHII